MMVSQKASPQPVSSSLSTSLLMVSDSYSKTGNSTIFDESLHSLPPDNYHLYHDNDDDDGNENVRRLNNSKDQQQQQHHQQQQQQQQQLNDSDDYDDDDDTHDPLLLRHINHNNNNNNSTNLNQINNNLYTTSTNNSTFINGTIGNYSTIYTTGLRERTTSQTSVQQEIRDRTFSQNSVEQLESQQYRSSRITSSSSKYIISSPPPQQQQQRKDDKSNSTNASITAKERQQQLTYEWLRALVLYIQSIRVPIWILRYYRKKRHPTTIITTKIMTQSMPKTDWNETAKNIGTTTSIAPRLLESMNQVPVDVLQQQSSSNSTANHDTNVVVNNNDDDDTTLVYWIQGLDRVLFTKDSCCAQDVKIMGWKPPQYMWFFVSGACCDLIQLSMLYLLHNYLSLILQLPDHQKIDTSISWMIAFCISIAFRHTSHRYFVFGNYIGGYTHSLLRIYMGYSVTIVLSTILNHILNRIYQLNLFLLAICTMLWTGVVNYFILKYFWNIGKKSGSGKNSGSNSNAT